MGCLKKIIQSVILCFAIIGFMSIGGGDFVKTKWSEYQAKHLQNVEKKANKIGDFSNISDEFEISQTASLLGYNGVIAEHKASGQKMVILDTKGKDVITEQDIKNNLVDEKIKTLTKKFRYSAVKIEDIKIGTKGSMLIYGKNVPYVKFSAKVSKLPFGNVDGMISAYDDNEMKRVFISINERNKYSQLISQEFFKKVKK